MYPEARKYYSKREWRSNKNHRNGGGRRRKVRNPAGFELLGIGIGVGLCIGFLLGFTLKGLGTGTIRIGGTDAPAQAALEQPEFPTLSDAERDMTRMRKIANTQAALSDWESESFGIKPQQKVDNLEKANRIIDGMYQDLEDHERQQTSVAEPASGLPKFELE
ncbi:MAG: hypothetical protein ACI9TH_003418 [Kiritimatiellia bacterium]|jgi:hypothetical protein